MRRWGLAGKVVVLVCAASVMQVAASDPANVAAAGAAQVGLQRPDHFADSEDAAKVAGGKLIYARACASCHGRRLQGQPLWQLDDQYRGQRAPAHDQTGHTWAHSDDDLFGMTHEGHFPRAYSPLAAVTTLIATAAAAAAPAASAPVPAARGLSRMHAFDGLLTDQQIVSVIAFIKATWPIGLRVSQAMLNPGQAGMPANAADVEWTFPPNCTASTQRWRATSR